MSVLIARRSLLLGGLGAGLPMRAAFAFDRVAAGSRYRQWLAALQDDLAALMSGVARDQPASEADVARLCSRSIVPDSRAAANFAGWANDSRRRGSGRASGEIVFVGPLQIVLWTLQASIPAGSGGSFGEQSGNDPADKALTVWYVHIHDAGALTKYFADERSFKPYHLPAEGRLERKAYPFLLFEDTGATLRFGGFSGEWMNAVATLDQMQYQ